MEVLTACAVAALSIINSLIDADPDARIDGLVLRRKSGGKSGAWGRLVVAAESLWVNRRRVTKAPRWWRSRGASR
jgi:hypothetical protein